ncbi:MAG: alpha/beta fold hydrolase, partial [Anaerolineae bacterium]|nr:alpha/beta fold hydrolase [Anaerolineae bacterium]
AWLDRTLYPFQSRYLDLEGNSIHYIDEGAGPILLFLHASPAWSFLYRNIITGLRDQFRCIALDYPGFGLSQAGPGYRNTLTANSRLVERFIQRLGLTDVTLYVHDASCAIGLGVAGRQPDWFRAAIISSSFAWPLDDYPDIVRFLKIVASPFFGLLINNFDFFTRYFVKNLNGGRLSEAERAAYRGPFRQRSARRVQQEFFSSIVQSRDYLIDLEQRLLALDNLPVLLVYGTEDPAYKAGWLARFQKMFPRHRSLVLEGADHFPQEHDPAQIVATIRDWWEKDVVES